MKATLLTAAALATCALAATPANAVNLVQNGGFEQPTVTDPCCITSPPTPIPFWDADPDVNVVNGTFSSSPPGTNLAYEGNQYLDLVGQAGHGSITQEITGLTVGTIYTLSFYYSHNLFAGLTSASASYTLSNEDVFGTFTHTGGSNSDLAWTLLTTNFTATNSSTLLQFTNLTGAQNEGVFLDAISISQAVPEPATWAMMLLGFGGIGLTIRRRRRPVLAQVA
jgi:hypothetical protein